MPNPRIPAAPAGTRFGAWTVLGEAGRNRHGGTTVLARCDCGTERILTQSNLRETVMVRPLRKYPASRAPLVAIDASLEERLAEAAAASGRSLIAETQFRLEQSFNDDAIMKELRLIRKLLQSWMESDNG